MPSLRDIKRRITSVQNTQQITRAMRMVSAAKLRRAQEAILAARPYAEKLEEVLSAVASRAEGVDHPLLRHRPIRRVELVVMTSDRGLAGAFNSNITRLAQRFLWENEKTYEKIQISTIGRKGADFFRSRGIETRKDYTGVFEALTFEQAQAIAKELREAYEHDELDAVLLLYNEFASAMVQRPSLVQLLPIRPDQEEEQAPEGADYLYEPNAQEVLGELLPRHLEMQVWRALLESVASEHAARMVAMENATKNSGELIAKYTLQYNRARQAYITTELMEIVSGAEALK